MSTSVNPIIDSAWVVAMINVGFIGVIIHLYFLYKSFRFYMDAKNRMFIVSSILLFMFNTMACLLWAIFRTNIMINLTVQACQLIYILNYSCYFIAKYILHCLLIFRVYMTFRRSTFFLSRKKTLICLIIVSINFFVAMSVWIVSITPNILIGKWTINETEYEICTLFSDKVNNHLMIRLSAITIGMEDFIVGGSTLCVFLSRFRVVAQEADDKQLLESSIRFGICALFSIISTFFLFTLAIQFYPNVTFILGIDATINSLCIFCVTAFGAYLYKYICIGCYLWGVRWVNLQQINPALTSSELIGKMFAKNIEPDLNHKSFSVININGINGLTATIGPPPKSSLPPVHVHVCNELPALKLNSKSAGPPNLKKNQELSTHLTKLPSLHPSLSDPVRTHVKD